MPNAGPLFLSYSSRDRDKVRAIHRYLSERGITTFFERPPHETWDMAVFTPGERPWFRLADALGPLRFPDKSDTELDIEIDKLASALHSGELSLDSLLDRILQRQGKLHRLLLVVDQLEELFTLTPAPDRGVFVNRLVDSLAVEGLVLVPTLRADFYGQAIEANRRLSDLLGQEQVTLGRLTAEELSRAVVEPARLEFDPGLPELLLRDAGNEPGSLPASEQETVEVAHEALICEWDRLKSWLNEDRGFYLWRQRLEQAIRDYEEHGQPADYLLQGPALKEAEGKLAAPMPEPLAPYQRGFIQASLDERDRTEAQRCREKGELQQREREALALAAEQERQARQAAERAKRISWFGAMILLAIAVFASLQYSQANSQHKVVTAQTLALRANALQRKQKHTLSTLLAALSLQVQSTQEAKGSAIALLARREFRGRPLRRHERAVSSVAFSVDGTRIVSGSEDKTLRLWDARSGQAPR